MEFLSGLPRDPNRRSLWCQQKLQERQQSVLKSRDINITNAIKVPQRRKRCKTSSQTWKINHCHADDKHTQMKPFARKRKQAKLQEAQPTPTRGEHIVQVFVYSDVAEVQVVETHLQDCVSSIKREYRKRCPSLPENWYLTTSKGFLLCDNLSLEDHSIRTDVNLYVSMGDRRLRGGSDKEGGYQNKSDQTKKKEFTNSIQSDETSAYLWKKEDVRRWLSETVKLSQKYVDRIFEEEVDGITLLMYEEDDIRSDFNMKRGPLTSLIGNRRSLIEKNSNSVTEFGKLSSLPLNLDEWSSKDVEIWLKSIGCEKYTDIFKDEEVNGMAMRFLTFEELESNFKMRKGPIRKFLYLTREMMASALNQNPYHPQEAIQEEPMKRTPTSLPFREEYCLIHNSNTATKQTFGEKMNALKRQMVPSNDHTSEETAIHTHSNDTGVSDAHNTSAHVKQELATTIFKDKDDTKKDGGKRINVSKTKQSHSAVVTSRKEKESHMYESQFLDQLSQKLQLQFENPEHAVQNYYPCTLQIISAKWGKEENLLERQFCFITIKKGQTGLSKKLANSLWRQIQNNVKEMINFLPEDHQNMFDLTISCESNSVARSSDKCILRLRDKGLSVCPLLQKTTEGILKHSALVLLVDSKMLTANSCYYGAYLDGKEKNQVFFEFSKNHPCVASFDISAQEPLLKFSDTVHICRPSEVADKPNLSFKQKDDADVSVPQGRAFPPNYSNNQRSNGDSGTKEHVELQHEDSLKEASTNAVTQEESCRKTQNYHFEDDITEDDTQSDNIRGNTRDEVQNFEAISTYNHLQQKPRLFDRDSDNCTYTRNRILDVIETGTIDLIQPIHEYKQFTTYAKSEKPTRICKFVREVLRFACACVNERTNGTIHFGIADSKTGKHQHGQILGVDVPDKTEYEEELESYIKRCFPHSGDRDVARNCIRPPRYVPVTSVGHQRQTYVIEVDVVPDSIFCKDIALFVKLPKLPNEGTQIRRISFEEKALYRRQGSSSCKTEGQELHIFLACHLNDLVVKRSEAEKISTGNQGGISVLQRNRLARKLTWLLCTGQTTLDSSFYPILVINTPKPRQTVMNDMEFLTAIDWVAVFDFDSESQTHGTCHRHSRTKPCNIQDPDIYFDIHDVHAHSNNIGFPEKTCWIFCNGRREIDDNPSTDRLSWNIQRSRGVKEAIRFFANEKVIPKGRAIIVFLLLSDDFEMMLDTFGEFVTYFLPERIMCVAENESTFHGWAKEIAQTYCPMNILESRSVVGMPWSHVNQVVLQMKGVRQDGISYIPSSTGALVLLREKDKSIMNDLLILLSNECEEGTDTMTKEELIEFIRNEEFRFYQGHQVTWWNFWASDHSYNHVLKRDKHDELKGLIEEALSPDPSSEIKRVSTVSLFHQPGSGGTTLVRYVLWEFRKLYRCVVVERITANTADQLIKLWQYGEKITICKPIIAIVEEHEELLLRELQNQIEEICIKRGLSRNSRPVCILVNCKRYMSHEPKLGYTLPVESVTLNHALSVSERTWFAQKLDQLEKTCRDFEEFDPRHLISFMILKENFNKQYVENVVDGILGDIPRESAEFLLLKYVALLNTYMIDSSLAVSCCDALMSVGYYQRGKRENKHVEFLLSASTKLLLLEMQKVSIGSVKAFKIVHPLVAREVLKQAMIKAEQNLSDVALEFLTSLLFKANSHATRDLELMTTEMLKRRKKYEYGDDVETKFSPLIMDILSTEDEENATNVLLEGVRLFPSDAMIPQQVARMYIHRKEFKEAKEFAQKAIAIKPDNSYLLDTLGEVYKEQMNSDYQDVKVKQKKITPSEAVGAIRLGFDAMGTFRKAQKAEAMGRYAINTGVYQKDVETFFRLMEILECVTGFHKPDPGLNELHRYLVLSDYIPSYVDKPWESFHEQFKGLKSNIDKTLDWLTDYCTYYKEEFYYDNSYFNSLKNKMYDFNSKYSIYLGERTEDIPKDVDAVDEINEWRRRRVARLGCNNFRNIFNLVKKSRRRQDTKSTSVMTLKTAKKLLSENTPRNEFDLHCLISINLALSSLDSSLDGVASIKQVHELTKLYMQVSQGNRLYPYFFLSMLSWPRENMDISYDSKSFRLCLQDLKDNYSLKERERRDPIQIKKYRKISMWKVKPSTFFFLGKGKGLRSFVHISELGQSEKSNIESKEDRFWESSKVKRRLFRLRGMLWSANVVRANDVRDSDKATIDVRPCIPLDNVINREPVTFYLGFSWEGPVAYHIKPFDPDIDDIPAQETTSTSSPEEESSSNQSDPKPLDYQTYRRRHYKLTKTLQAMEELKMKKERGQKLEKNQIKKLERLEEVKREISTMETEYEEYIESNPDFLRYD